MTERVEVRWLRPHGEEAVSVQFTYASAQEASQAVEAVLTALEEIRHARTRSHAAQRDSAVGHDD